MYKVAKDLRDTYLLLKLLSVDKINLIRGLEFRNIHRILLVRFFKEQKSR